MRNTLKYKANSHSQIIEFYSAFNEHKKREGQAVVVQQVEQT